MSPSTIVVGSASERPADFNTLGSVFTVIYPDWPFSLGQHFFSRTVVKVELYKN